MRIGRFVLATVACIGVATSALALQPVEGKVCKPGDFIHGIWQNVVSSRPCDKPVYLSAGFLQGAKYSEGCYCFPMISKLQIQPYRPDQKQ